MQGLAGAMKGLGGKGSGVPTYGIIIVLTISVEEWAAFFMFECPCQNSNLLYG